MCPAPQRWHRRHVGLDEVKHHQSLETASIATVHILNVASCGLYSGLLSVLQGHRKSIDRAMPSCEKQFAPNSIDKTLSSLFCEQSINCETRSSGTDTNRIGDCLTLREDEYASFISMLPIVKAYAMEWGQQPAYMPKICGVNEQRYFCCTGQHKDRPSEFLIAPGMPYSVEHSDVFGTVYCTPFYSVIPANLTVFPDTIFCLTKLTFSRVINSHIFRHELAFNADLLIEPPQRMSEVSSSSAIWTALQFELSDLLKSQRAPASLPLLAHSFKGIRELMLSIMPLELSPYIKEFFDPSRLLPDCKLEYSVDELLTFTSNAIEASLLPMRKAWIQKLRKYFSHGQNDVSKLVAGFRIAIALLNLTKIDYINSQIRQRVAILRHNTGRFEKEHYRSWVRSGKINGSDFLGWLKRQPRISELKKLSHQANDSRFDNLNASLTLRERRERFIECLVGGFVSNFFCFRQRVSSLSIFEQDTTRINALASQFDGVVYSEVECHINSHKDARRLLLTPDIRFTKLYQTVEARILTFIAVKVFEKLMKLVFDKIPTFSYTLKGPESTFVLIEDITMILSLHWIGAHEFYEETWQD